MYIDELIKRCKELGATLVPHGNDLSVSAPSPLPDDLRNELRLHKAEILAYLKPQTSDGEPQWHAETIATTVRKEGACLFWSELFGEMIAFIKNDSYKNKVPCGLVTYTDKELKELFCNPSLPAESLRLIHEAKRAGGGNVIKRDTKLI